MVSGVTRAVEAVGQTEAGETAPQRVAGEGREAITVGRVVEQVLRPESVVQPGIRFSPDSNKPRCAWS